MDERVKNAGGFRIQRRQGNNWEVWYKNYRSEMMTLVAFDLTEEQAIYLRDRLHRTLTESQPADFPKSPVVRHTDAE
jgi:hypothetical protein